MLALDGSGRRSRREFVATMGKRERYIMRSIRRLPKRVSLVFCAAVAHRPNLIKNCACELLQHYILTAKIPIIANVDSYDDKLVTRFKI